MDAAQAAVNRRGSTFDFKTGDMFAAGQATILPAAEPLLDRVAQNLIFLGVTNYRVDIEGHTDDVPINTAQSPSKWELSAARASAVARFLISRGVKADRITVLGYADTRPKAPNRDEAGNPIPQNRADNRRVVVRIER
jgi:chemotaxis protein MotB